MSYYHLGLRLRLHNKVTEYCTQDCPLQKKGRKKKLSLGTRIAVFLPTGLSMLEMSSDVRYIYGIKGTLRVTPV